jgi:deoxyribose-phosphate aldolase
VSDLNSKDLDRLVDVISKRVEQELAKRRSPKPAPPAAEGVADCKSCPARKSCDPAQVIGAINAGAKRIGANPGIEAAPCSHVAPLIDHTLLKPEATREELKQLCDEARRFGFATVCVNSTNIRAAAQALQGSNVKPIAVVGFPLGAMLPSAKAFETREAIRNGAQEIDMVINIGALKSKDYALVLDDMRAVVQAAGTVPVKVILETSKLDRDEKLIASALSKAAGAAFVKTSTGFGGGGATVEDVALMRKVVGEEIGVKASGGIRTIDDAEQMVAAGANRLGASSSVAIVRCERGDKSGGAKKAY